MGEYKLNMVYIKMVNGAELLSNNPIRVPEDAVKLIGKHMCDLDREILFVINLAADGKPINIHPASIGTLNATLASPREMLKSTILSNAAGIMIIHNHPSGNLTPSRQDVEITDRMNRLCGLLGVDLLDHIIVGRDKDYYSFRQKCLLSESDLKYAKNADELELSVAEAGIGRPR